MILNVCRIMKRVETILLIYVENGILGCKNIKNEQIPIIINNIYIGEMSETASLSPNQDKSPTQASPPKEAYPPAVSQKRLLFTTFIILPAILYYWNDLLESQNGSTFNASVIAGLAIVCGLVDLNGLSGQPEGDHDHDHDD